MVRRAAAGWVALVFFLACGSSGTLPILTSADGSNASADHPDASAPPGPAADAASMDTGGGGASPDARAAESGGGTEGGDGALSGGPDCGNGVVDPGEQCDDGNHFNLDGCDSACRYEVVTRMTVLSVQGTPAPAFCTPTTNRFGTQSITSTGLGQLNPSVQSNVTSAKTNTFIEFVGLQDPTGATANGFSLGLLGGQLDSTKGTWPGNNPIDWWFLGDHATIDSSGLPTSLFPNGALAGGALTAGPTDVNLPLPLGGAAALLRVREAHLSATISAAPPPSVPGPPPGKIASGLTVFETITADGTDQGLCGNMTVESLANTPIPQVLTSGTTACSSLCIGSRGYSDCGPNNPVGPGCNSWLDVLVGGCSVTALCAAVVQPQQPDVTQATTVQVLTLGPGNKVPSAQTAGNNDAYSVYLKFDANRAHITGETCGQTSDCQTGKACVGGTCQ